MAVPPGGNQGLFPTPSASISGANRAGSQQTTYPGAATGAPYSAYQTYGADAYGVSSQQTAAYSAGCAGVSGGGYYGSVGWPQGHSGAGYNAASLGYGVGAGMAYGAVEEDTEEPEIPHCHLHTKPVLTCKFCRRYKSNLHHHARRAIMAQAGKPQEEKRNMVEMTNTTTYNVNNLLRENILNSEYFKSLYQMKSFSDVVDEIYHYAKDAEPYCAGNSRAPSTLFCCLYKLMTMRLTDRQMDSLLYHNDSPYIRCTGFLYLRLTSPPEKLWSWYEPHFLDDETFTPGADKQNKTMTTIGEYIESLLTEDKYFTTVLPRLPVRIKTDYGTQLMAMSEHRTRKQQNKLDLDRFIKGADVLVCSNGDWLESEVVEIVENHKGKMSAIVQLEEHEEIDLGLVILKEPESRSPSPSETKRKKHKKKKHKSFRRENGDEDGQGNRTASAASGADGSSVVDRDHKTSKRRRSPGGRRGGNPTESAEERTDRGHRRRRRSPNAKEAPQESEDEEIRALKCRAEFKRRERAKVLASGKDYARRPTSYKSSLSLKLDASNARRTTKSPSPPGYVDGRVTGGLGGDRSGGNGASRSDSPTGRAANELSREQQRRMAQLIEHYNKSSRDLSQNKRADLEGPDTMRLGGGRGLR